MNRLVVWWRVRDLQAERVLKVDAYNAACRELDVLKAEKFRRRWERTPTLDSRIRAAQHYCAGAWRAVRDVDDRIAEAKEEPRDLGWVLVVLLVASGAGVFFLGRALL